MRVGRELAIKLKEKGFDVPCDAKLKHDTIAERVDERDWNNYTNTCSVPTIEQVLTWLRSKGLHVYCKPNTNQDLWWFIIDTKGGDSKQTGVYDDHYDALLYGVTAAVEMVG